MYRTCSLEHVVRVVLLVLDLCVVKTCMHVGIVVHIQLVLLVYILYIVRAILVTRAVLV